MLQVRGRADGVWGLSPLDQVSVARGEALEGVAMREALLACADDAHHTWGERARRRGERLHAWRRGERLHAWRRGERLHACADDALHLEVMEVHDEEGNQHAISLHSAGNLHAISMQSPCNLHTHLEQLAHHVGAIELVGHLMREAIRRSSDAIKRQSELISGS